MAAQHWGNGPAIYYTDWNNLNSLFSLFRDLSTDNLRFLSSRQALADLAHFRTVIAEARGLTDEKWVAFGGSYPGSLAAWFRLKYPQLVYASVATSAPVQATVNFPGMTSRRQCMMWWGTHTRPHTHTPTNMLILILIAILWKKWYKILSIMSKSELKNILTVYSLAQDINHNSHMKADWRLSNYIHSCEVLLHTLYHMTRIYIQRCVSLLIPGIECQSLADLNVNW